MNTLLINHFTERFRHDWWANETLLDMLELHVAEGGAKQAPAKLAKTCRLFGHLFSSELIWLGRILETHDQSVPVWRTLDLEGVRPLYEDARDKWRGYLETLRDDDLSRSIKYRNTVGESYRNTLIQIVAHVLNHSSHHRAQIQGHLREMGLEPPGVDYIVYLRLQ